MSRAIDHIVLPVDSLDEVADTLERIGFTVTPRADHPWGTANRLVQMDGSFLEYLEIADRDRFYPPGEENAFDFARFLDAWHGRLGAGAAMLVLVSRGADRDRAEFTAAGLTVHEPFGFERVARLPDGTEKKVAFSLTFVSDPALPDLGFFTCEHHFPENFWKPEYQHHDNGVTDLAGVVIVAEVPSDHHAMLSSFIGQRDIRSTSLGIEIGAGRHFVSMVTPIGYESLYGPSYTRLDGPDATIAALRLNSQDPEALRRKLEASGLRYDERGGRLIVPSASAHGCALIFENAAGNQS
ncbi:MAG: VOC family protein [Pseudomonadota bacterium]